MQAHIFEAHIFEAHISSGVVMDIAAFKVSHSSDKDATALQAKSGARNVPSVHWMKVQGMLKRRAHLTSLVRVHVGVDQPCRALDVKSSAPLPTMSTRVTFQRGDGTLHMGSIRRKAHPLPQRT